MTRPVWSIPSALLQMVLVALLAGCVYYNGMYNANRLAKSARKAEREGRTFDANNLWGQVATKAESVVVRHPRSKYADEAAVLRGLALAHLGQCEEALGPLGRAALLRTNTDLSEDAWLAMGLCQVGLGNIAAADAAFVPLLESKNSERRIEARYQHARAARHAGRYQDALSALEGIRDPRAEAERFLALAGTGRVPEALRLADSMVAANDTTKPWDSLVVALGRQDPAAASSLVDRIHRLANRPAETKARWLLEDGQRLVHSDTARAETRFREALKIGGSGDAAGRAGLQLVRLDVGRAGVPQDLPPVAEKLAALAARYPTVSTASGQLGATVAGILAASSVTAETPQGDLRLFLAAEQARDSLTAPRLATMMFHRIIYEWPGSPYAPKAILAAQQLDPLWADSARVLLEGQYYDSPYLALIRGESTPAYQQLEDSLGAFAARISAPGGRRAPVRDDNAQPRRRPQPAPSTRVIEPQ
jgi:tetratricopeptide (TPR) repeat protein